MVGSCRAYSLINSQLIISMDSTKIQSMTWSDRSSTVDQTTYNPDTKELMVWYKGGAKYRYDDVPPEVWDVVLNSASVGSALSLNVKNHYRYERLV